jgi:hypothetical protein
MARTLINTISSITTKQLPGCRPSLPFITSRRLARLVDVMAGMLDVMPPLASFPLWPCHDEHATFISRPISLLRGFHVNAHSTLKC